MFDAFSKTNSLWIDIVDTLEQLDFYHVTKEDRFGKYNRVYEHTNDPKLRGIIDFDHYDSKISMRFRYGAVRFQSAFTSDPFTGNQDFQELLDVEHREQGIDTTTFGLQWSLYENGMSGDPTYEEHITKERIIEILTASFGYLKNGT